MPAIKSLKWSISKYHDQVCKLTDVSVHESTEQLSNVCIKNGCPSLLKLLITMGIPYTIVYITVAYYLMDIFEQ